jgi:signal transduction histidine kinase
MARERLAAARSLELVESKNRALEAFAARAAHDLRSPLVPIHSLASLIVRAGRDEADVRLASRIVGSASRMSAVIDAMLAFSRSGLLPRGRTEVQNAVTEALADLGAVAGGAEVVLQLEEATVACAPEVLGQILRNVMGNALKYRVPDRPLPPGGLHPGRDVLGVGRGRGQRPGHGARSRPASVRAVLPRDGGGSGHGLGLAIVDSYVRALGGSVQLRSESGGDPGVDPVTPDAPWSGGGHARPTRAAAPGPPATGHRNLSAPPRGAAEVHPQRISGPVLPGTERRRGLKRAASDERCHPRVFTPG